MQRIIFTLIFTLLFVAINAQKDTPFDKKSIPFKTTLTAVQDSLNEGDLYFNMLLYKKALSAFQFAQEQNPNNSILNFKIGVCYLEGPHKDKARPYFEKANILNSKISEDIYYYLGRSYQFEGDWEKAKEYFSKYSKSQFAEDAIEHIAQCERAIEFSKNPLQVNIQNVGPAINTQYAEYSAIISADGHSMYFTSREPGTTGAAKDYEIDEWMEDVYKSEYIDGEWKQSINIGSPVNTESHDAMVSLSVDGQTLFIYRDENDNAGDIYMCQLEGDEWSYPRALNNKINTEHHETSASLSPDEKTLYFVTDKPGGIGNADIYTAHLNEQGEWDSIQNIGPIINTEKDEEAVFIHPDGKTLYFSSKGHGNIGGYDVFVTTMENGSWTTPVNLGVPINTADDDVFFVMDASGKNGYYSSGKIGGYGEKDIYLLEFEIEKSIALLKGKVLDEGLNPLAAKMLIIDDESGELVNTIHSNSATGEYLVTLEKNNNYRVESQYGDYPDIKETVNVPNIDGFQEIIKDFIFSYPKPDTIVEPVAVTEAKPGYVYTIQYFATINSGKAEKTKAYLQKMGISDVYIQKVIFTDTDEINYRVRSGKYYTFEAAVEDGNKLNAPSLPDKGYWIDNVREEDYSVKKLEYDILN